MIKLVTAVIKPHMLEPVKDGLKSAGVKGVTVTQVMGYGRQGGHTETYRGAEYAVDLVPKLKVEVLCSIDDARRIFDVVRDCARTGEIGDGKVWIADVEHLARVRTAELGEEAI